MPEHHRSRHYIFAQANSLAVAVVDAETALTASARLRFVRSVRVGERIVAEANVVSQKGNKHLVRAVSARARPSLRVRLSSWLELNRIRRGENELENSTGRHGGDHALKRSSAVRWNFWKSLNTETLK